MEAALLEEEAALTAKEVAKLEVTAEAERRPRRRRRRRRRCRRIASRSRPEGAHADAADQLPGVRGIGEMSVELAEREIVLSGGGYSLRESLPFAVDSSRATASSPRRRRRSR